MAEANISTHVEIREFGWQQRVLKKKKKEKKEEQGRGRADSKLQGSGGFRLGGGVRKRFKAQSRC